MNAERNDGVPGNFTLDEAVSICHAAHVPVVVAYHYGPFDFNTVSAGMIDARAVEEQANGFSLLRARLGAALQVASI